ncbi:MAG: PD-(D/E)XK nuclease family transposase, partial [Lachnospiraceae bacterium]|nr:PD-(D/E)XK nuclease family transposase [Lachnospiraceae bacterium]
MGKVNRDVGKIIDRFTLWDDELMSRVFDGNIEATEYLLQTILGRSDIRVKTVKGECSMKSPRIGGKGVRFDIRARNTGGEDFDVEVQKASKGAHVRRARYNSSMMDSRLLDEDEDYSKLKDSYVIFIYERDKFRRKLPVYHIDRCVKETGQEFGDGSHIIYVNGRYKGDDEIGRMIHDFKCKRSEDAYNSILAEGIRYYKETQEGREEMSEAVEKYGDKREK